MDPALIAQVRACAQRICGSAMAAGETPFDQLPKLIRTMHADAFEISKICRDVLAEKEMVHG